MDRRRNKSKRQKILDRLNSYDDELNEEARRREREQEREQRYERRRVMEENLRNPKI